MINIIHLCSIKPFSLKLYQHFYRLRAFIDFYWSAKTIYNIQSSYLHHFNNSVLETDKEYYRFQELQFIKSQLSKDNRIIEINDLGSGSAYSKNKIKSISTILNQSVSSNKKLKILFQLVNFSQAKMVLELGTSLGLSSAYMACANSNCQITTIEGDSNISMIAKEVHQKLSLNNIKILCDSFDKILPSILILPTYYDIVYIDGNHNKESTVKYVKLLLKNTHKNSIFVIDDIYWSRSMGEAWSALINMNEFTLSVDLFQMGILFRNPSLSKENIKIIPYKYKPWQVGIFQ